MICKYRQDTRHHMSCSQVYWKDMKCPVKGFWVPVIQECSTVGRLLFALNIDNTALACVVYPQFFPQPCESICLHFSVSPSALMTYEPMGELWWQKAKVEHFGISWFFRWVKEILCGTKWKAMEGIPTQRTGVCFISFMPWLMRGINQQLQLTRQLKAEDTNLWKTRLPWLKCSKLLFMFKQTVCVLWTSYFSQILM